MEVEQIRPRLWRWTATHPDWSPEEGGPDGWEPEVSSHALVEEDALVLIDPLVPADDEERFWHALDSDVEHHGAPEIVLTGYWHARSSQTIFDRYPGARVWVPESAAEKAREWVELTDTFVPGDTLPGGVDRRDRLHDRGVALDPLHRALARATSCSARPRAASASAPTSG
jgi:hypothetical protein